MKEVKTVQIAALKIGDTNMWIQALQDTEQTQKIAATVETSP